jgi:MYXO-CTERM domain-containing protein
MGAVVSDATPVLSGTAEAGATVRVSVDGVLIGTAVADASGAWSVPVPVGQVLPEGAHEVRADATDAAGNRSGESTSSFTVRFEVDSGVSDAGVADAGVVDAGVADAGELDIEDGGVDALSPELNLRGGGCGCGATDGSAMFGLLGLLGLGLRRRRFIGS